MMKKLLIPLITVTIISTAFTSCKEKYSLIEENRSDSVVQAKIVFPEYKKYPDLNEKIRSFIDDDLENYKNECEQFWNAGSQYPYSYRTTFEDKSNSDYINCFISKYIFSGISTETEYFFTFVYNKKTRKIETIENVSEKSLKEIAKLCEEDIKKQVQKETGEKVDPFIEDWIKTGTSPRDINYTAWTASKNVITVYFKTGQVLTKYFGSRKVTIPLKQESRR